MKILLAMIVLLALSVPCFAYDCLDSPEYQNSKSMAMASVSENGTLLGTAVDFLVKKKNISDDQALREIMQISTVETVAYDNALKEIAEKIKLIKPKNQKECAELIELQNKYRTVGNDKIKFIVNKVIGQ